MTETVQKCRSCGERLPLSLFHKKASEKNGRRKECRVCGNAKRREYRIKNIDTERIRERKKNETKPAHIKRKQASLSRSKYLHQNNATKKLRYAVKKGKIHKPSICSSCGASGDFALLTVTEIPDDVDWQIEEYDGYEHIAEKHRTW